MRLLLVVNDPDTELEVATTTLLALAACRRGHDVFLAGVRELEYFADGQVGARARLCPGGAGSVAPESEAALLEAVRGPAAPRETVTTRNLDVIWLRYNPTEEVGEDAWAQNAGILFGQVAVERGVIVLNHPHSLPAAISKMYLQQFPAAVRPAAIITRSYERVVEFQERVGGRVVLKPLLGHGGTDVFLVDRDAENLRQIIESLSRGSYVIAQEYLPAAAEGDTRLFLVNGSPLCVDGRCAAIRRRAAPGDFRSNMSAGGSAERAKVDERMLRVARIVGPRLVKDGIFFAGLDVVGDRLVEINAISAGGLHSARELEGVDFGPAVIEAVERKVFYRRHHGEQIRNIEVATLD